jgi:Icc-related predicted phosphoesterase
MVFITATSDLDTPGALQMFLALMQKAKEPELFLFAGDMMQAYHTGQYQVVLRIIKERGWTCPIVAVFGNHEFEQEYDKIREICGDRIRFLVDETIKLKIGDKTVGIVGSKGCLDQPTFWQARHMENIREEYEERTKKIGKLLEELKADVRILLTHYAPTYKTLKGENPELWSSLGTRKLEQAIAAAKPDAVVHGHAHYGAMLAFIESIPVFNVALPLNKRFVEIDTGAPPSQGLKKFIT